MAELPEFQVIKEHEFEEQLRALIANYEDADTFTAAAEEVLARDPRVGLPVEGDIWFLPMSPIGGRNVSLYYTFDSATVVLLAIVATD